MNRSRGPTLLAAALLTCIGTAAAATLPASSTLASPGGHAAPKPNVTPKIKSILTAMDNSATAGHPDLFYEFAGMQRYFKDNYKGAMKYFKLSARYADKRSQTIIGLMYYNGEGVKKDPATACAWLTLAAERNYKAINALRDGVCKKLTSAQPDRAIAIFGQLLSEYGDKVAKKRMRLAMNAYRMESSPQLLIGFNHASAATGRMGSMGAFSLGNLSGGCGKPTITYAGVPLPAKGCATNDFWAPWYWTPKTYFAVRDEAWRATVIVGPLEVTRSPASSADKRPQSTNQPPPASASSAGH